MELVLLTSQVLGGGTALGHPHELPVTVEGLLCYALARPGCVWYQRHTRTVPQSLSMQLGLNSGYPVEYISHPCSVFGCAGSM